MPVQRDVLAPLQGLRETHLEWPWVGKMRRTEHKHGKKEWGAETSSGRTMQGFEAEPTTHSNAQSWVCSQLLPTPSGGSGREVAPLRHRAGDGRRPGHSRGWSKPESAGKMVIQVWVRAEAVRAQGGAQD